MINLAENLEGRILNDKWRIISKKNIAVGRTPGQFSICYLVEEIETKKIAFLKAFDIQSFIKSGNSAEALKLVAEAYLFEKNLLERCKDIRLRRVVVSIDYGEYIPKDALYPVYFLIFEMADDDIRKYTDLAKGIDIAWLLKVMHTVAVGVQELHNNLIAHQDLKPANILVFNENLSKIGDLGRAWSENINSPFDSLEIPGDKRYAPIEYLYGNYPADEKNRRFIYDLYSLGIEYNNVRNFK